MKNQISNQHQYHNILDVLKPFIVRLLRKVKKRLFLILLKTLKRLNYIYQSIILLLLVIIILRSLPYWKEENESGIISVKQSDNFVSVEEIDKLINKLKTYDKKGYILFSILKHHHLRNEIATLQIIKLQEFKKLKTPDKKDKNYMVVGTKKLFISRNGYKTDKKYGEIVFEITDKKLNKEVRNYIKGLDGNEEMFSFPDINGEGNDKKKQLSNYMSYVSNIFIGSKISTTNKCLEELCELIILPSFIRCEPFGTGLDFVLPNTSLCLTFLSLSTEPFIS